MGKRTFAAGTFKANTFASGTFRGVGVTPKPASGGGGDPPESFARWQKQKYEREKAARAKAAAKPAKAAKAPAPTPPAPEPPVPFHVLAALDDAFAAGGLDAMFEAESRLLAAR